jgi:hypothetical protein
VPTANSTGTTGPERAVQCPAVSAILTRVRAKVTSTATGAVLVESVLVVRIRDGRLGFSTSPANAERLIGGPQVTLAGPSKRISGVAEVVRSGTAYEEVHGRARMAQGRLARWRDTVRNGREAAVVLVRVS